MRILMLAPEPFFTPRGTPFSVLGRLQALSALGHRVDLVTYPFGQDVLIPNLRIIRCPRPPGVRRVPIGPSIQKVVLDISLYRTALRLLRTGSYDLVHTHEEASLIGAWWQKHRRIPHLYDMHSLLSQQMFNFQVPLAPVAAALWRRLERWTLRHTKAVIAICGELADAVRVLRPDVSCEVIENVAVAEFVERVDEARVRAFRQRWNPGDSYLAVYVGTFEPYQGVNLLLEAIGRLAAHPVGATVHWILAGLPPDRLSEWQARVDALGVRDRVTLLERQPPEEAAVLQRAADLLVSPRIAGTNTPLKIYSYLAAGRPILATRHPTHTQVLNDTVALLVKPSVEGLMEGVCYARTHPEEMEARAQRARLYFHQHYGYQAFIDKTARILHAAAGSSYYAPQRDIPSTGPTPSPGVPPSDGAWTSPGQGRKLNPTGRVRKWRK